MEHLQLYCSPLVVLRGKFQLKDNYQKSHDCAATELDLANRIRRIQFISIVSRVYYVDFWDIPKPAGFCVINKQYKCKQSSHHFQSR